MAYILVEILISRKKFLGRVFWIILGVCILFLFEFLRQPPTDVFTAHFLNVGQGDSQLITFPGGVQMLIDGGKQNGLAAEEISHLMPLGDNTIELMALTHPQLDHYGGLIDVLKRYRVNVFLWNGRRSDGNLYEKLEEYLRVSEAKSIVVRKGDGILYGSYAVNAIWPEEKYVNTNDANDGSLVFEVTSPELRILFTGDIGEKIEKEIIKTYRKPVDVLKVPHHGSKYSSSETFLRTLNPSVAVIGVGKNSYGHPTKEVISRFISMSVKLFRTDKDGTVTVVPEDGTIRIFQKPRLE